MNGHKEVMGRRRDEPHAIGMIRNFSKCRRISSHNNSPNRRRSRIRFHFAVDRLADAVRFVVGQLCLEGIPCDPRWSFQTDETCVHIWRAIDEWPHQGVSLGFVLAQAYTDCAARRLCRRGRGGACAGCRIKFKRRDSRMIQPPNNLTGPPPIECSKSAFAVV